MNKYRKLSILIKLIINSNYLRVKSGHDKFAFVQKKEIMNEYMEKYAKKKRVGEQR
jgi:hypothetical protein